jgi:hypothetical protein
MTKQSEYLEENIVILAIRNQMGNVGLAAKELGLSRGELVDYMVRHPSVMDTKKQIKEFVKDQAEDLLVQKMQDDPTLLMFFLKTQARDRGYDLSSAPANVTNRVEVKVDAKFLIAAMRQAADQPKQEEIIEHPLFPARLVDNLNP